MADLTRNAVDVLPAGRLEEQLAGGRPLRVKLGIDPTTADIHLGHTVVLEKLREFQEAGHQVVLIVGDFTARVGDPSGRSTQRPLPSPEEIEANAATYQEQAFKILDRERTEVRRNSEWLRDGAAGAARAARPDHGRPPARARRLPEAARGERADRRPRAALPAAAGIRLGRGRGRPRARRDRPEVQPALRPRHPVRLRPGAAVDPDHADPGRHRRRPEDEQVARQLRRGDRPARGDVRAPDADPRRGDGRVLPAAARRGAAGGRGAERGEAGAGAEDRRALPRRRPRPPRPRSTSTGSSSSARRPRRSRTSTSPPTRARTACSSTCRC